MKYLTVGDKKALKAAQDKLTELDKVILEKCREGLNIVRVLKAGKPYTSRGSKQFATTDEILASVDRLLKLKLLERR